MRIQLLFAAAVVLVAQSVVHANPRVYEAGLKSAVWIVTADSEGSGVVVQGERGLVVVTNEHVVGDHLKVKIVFPEQDDGRVSPRGVGNAGSGIPCQRSGAITGAQEGRLARVDGRG